MEERMARLERTCRRQQRALVVLVSVLAVAALTGAVNPVAQELRAKRIVVEAPNGAPRVSIDEGGVVVYSDSGTSLFVANGTADGITVGVVGKNVNGYGMVAYDSGLCTAWTKTSRGRMYWPQPQ